MNRTSDVSRATGTDVGYSLGWLEYEADQVGWGKLDGSGMAGQWGAELRGLQGW